MDLDLDLGLDTDRWPCLDLELLDERLDWLLYRLEPADSDLSRSDGEYLDSRDDPLDLSRGDLEVGPIDSDCAGGWTGVTGMAAMGYGTCWPTGENTGGRPGKLC